MCFKLISSGVCFLAAYKSDSSLSLMVSGIQGPMDHFSCTCEFSLEWKDPPRMQSPWDLRHSRTNGQTIPGGCTRGGAGEGQVLPGFSSGPRATLALLRPGPSSALAPGVRQANQPPWLQPTVKSLAFFLHGPEQCSERSRISYSREALPSRPLHTQCTPSPCPPTVPGLPLQGAPWTWTGSREGGTPHSRGHVNAHHRARAPL